MRRIALGCAICLVLVAAPSWARQTDPAMEQGQQWGLERVRAPAAWTASLGAGVVVAVIDTGVDGSHPDLVGKLVPGKDFTGSGTTADVNGHGTLISGIVGARTFNGIGIAGVAPRAKIMPIKVLDPDGTGASARVAKGIRWAVSNGADVINLSLAQEADGEVTPVDAPLRDPSVDAAIYNAVMAGVTVVVAAGNNKAGGKPATAYSSQLQGVIVVGAATRSGRRAAYSNYGNGLDLLAPGGGSARDPSDDACNSPSIAIVSTWWDPAQGRSRYGAGCGTSFAAGFVSGVAAMLRAQGLSNAEIDERIVSTADDLGRAGRDDHTGHGMLNAARALGVPESARLPATTRRASDPSTPSGSRDKPTEGRPEPAIQAPRPDPVAVGEAAVPQPAAQEVPRAVAGGLIVALMLGHVLRLRRRTRFA